MIRAGAAGAALSVGLVLVSAALAGQAEAPAAPKGGVSLGKAFTYETASSALEAGMFVAFFGGGVATAAPVMALSFSTSLGVYILNDYAWSLAPAAAPDAANWRILEKAATFRGLTVARSFGIASLLGGAKESAPLAFAAAYNLADTLLYIGVEKAFAGQGVGHGAGQGAASAPAE